MLFFRSDSDHQSTLQKYALKLLQSMGHKLYSQKALTLFTQCVDLSTYNTHKHQIDKHLYVYNTHNT